MADVAAHSGISVGALYRYFESKDALFVALTQMAREANQALWVEIKDSPNAAAQLHSFVNQYFDMAANPECRSTLALDVRLRGEALDSEVVNREVVSAYRVQMKVMQDLIESAKGSDGRGNASVEAQMLIGLLNEAGFRSVINSDFDGDAFRKTVLELIDVWISSGADRP